MSPTSPESGSPSHESSDGVEEIIIGADDMEVIDADGTTSRTEPKDTSRVSDTLPVHVPRPERDEDPSEEIEKLSPEEAAYRRWQENKELIRSNPQAAAEKIKVLNWLAVNMARNIGPVAVNKTATRITEIDRGRGRGATRNSHKINLFGIHEGDRRHRTHLFIELKGARNFDRNVKKILSRLDSGEHLTDQELNIFAAAIERNRKRNDELYPHGRREDDIAEISHGGHGFAVNPETIHRALVGDIKNYMDTERFLKEKAAADDKVSSHDRSPRPHKPSTSPAKDRTSHTRAAMDIGEPAEKEPELLDISDFLDGSLDREHAVWEMAHAIANQPVDIEHTLANYFKKNRIEGGYAHRAVIKIAAGENDDMTNEKILEYAGALVDILRNEKAKTDEAKTEPSRSEGEKTDPVKPEVGHKDAILENIISSNKGVVFDAVTSQPQLVIDLFHKMIPKLNEHDNHVLHVLNLLANGSMKAAEIDKNAEGAKMAGYIRGRLKHASDTKS